MELSPPEIISIFALLVSALSLGVAFLSYWRSYLAQQPIAWLEVQPTLIPNEWLGKIHVLNRSSFGWRVVQAAVPLTTVPLTDKQDFLIRAATESESAEAFGFLASFSAGILPGESGACSVMLRRGPLSDASGVTIILTLQSMMPKPRYKTFTIKAFLPRYGLTMVLD